MPFEGISFNDAGFKIAGHTEVNQAAESRAKADAETIIKKLDKAAKSQADPESEDKERDLQGRENSDGEDFGDDSEELGEAKKKIKKYKVKFNTESNMVELVARDTGEIVEVISPEELVNLVSKSKSASGILVDRKI